MALMEENSGNGFYMPVAPAYGGGNGGFGGFGNDWGWIILLLLFAGGGWGNGFGNGVGGFGGYDFPWLMNGQQNILQNTNGGFRDAMINDGITGIRDGIAGISTQLCNGFAGVSNGFAQAEIAENSRQMANMNQMFGLSQQLSQCCCDNRLATAQTQALVQSENCADRYEASQNTASIINAINGGIQSVKDQLCQDKIDAKNDTINQLRSELLYARGQASQDVQTAAIQAGQRALANEVEQYVAPKAVPAYVVQNPNCCATYTGCGCGSF